METIQVQLLLIIFFISIFYSSKYLILGTVIIYPFWLIIRNSSDSQILILLPEIVIFLSFIINFIFLNKNKVYLIEIKTFSLMFSFLLLSSLINIFHVGKLEFALVFIRLYLFPLLFFLTLASVIKKNNDIMLEALYTSILSFGIVALIALLNYFDLINVKDFNSLKIAVRDVIFFSKIKRLDPLISGAIGSAGAMFFTMGIILVYLKKRFNKITNIILSLGLLLAGILSLSYSLIYTIIIVIFMCWITKKNNYFLSIIFSLFFIIFIFFMLTTNFFLNQSVLSYIGSSYLYSYLSFFSNLTFIEILFGNGMPINMYNFYYVPEKFISDVGIGRVFTETGIINFFIFFYFLIVLFKKIISINPNFSTNYYNSLFMLFSLFILLPHTNILFTAPFYPTFIIVMSSILYEYKLKFSLA